MKTCTKCDTQKPLTAFYKHLRMADGHLNECAACCRERQKAHRAARLDHYREYDRRRGYREYDAHKAAARRATRVLQRKPCETCGSERSEAHHDDYAKPLDVRWLCRTHHAEAHRRVGIE